MSRRWMQLRLHNNNNRILRILLFIWQIYLTKESIVNCSQRCHYTEFSFLCSQDETILYLSRLYRKWQVDTELLLLFDSKCLRLLCVLCVCKRGVETDSIFTYIYACTSELIFLRHMRLLPSLSWLVRQRTGENKHA